MSSLIPYRRHHGLANPSSHSLFDDSFFRSFFDMGDTFGSSGFRVDIKDKKDHYELDVELPGVPKEQIDLSVEDGILTISANMNVENKEEREGYVYSERRSGHFQRSFNIEGVKEEEISAEFKDGILKLTLPKDKEEPVKKQKRIEIN